MDAVPMSLGQEFSGYEAMLDDCLGRIDLVLPGLYRLALGGTAVGTGITAAKGFGERAITHLAGITGLPLVPATNRFAAQGAHDAMVMAARLPTAMLFLRSPGGISHHPDETVREEDVEAALEVGRKFLERIAAEAG